MRVEYILFTLHSAALLEMRLSSVMYYLYTPSTRLFPSGRKMNSFEYICPSLYIQQGCTNFPHPAFNRALPTLERV